MPRNPSPAQIAAARANGARSRGPLSAAGKAKCSLNATTYGITARATCLPTENPEVFKTPFDALIEEFQPATTAELLCAEEMAAAKWKIRRLWNLETATLSAGLDSTPPSADPHARTSAAWKESQTQLDSYARHDSRLHHQYRRNLAQLEHLQLLRASMPVDPVMEPEPLPFLQNEPEPPPPTFPDGEPAEPIDPPWASIAHLLVPPADPIDQSAQNEPKNFSCFADWTGAEPPPRPAPPPGVPAQLTDAQHLGRWLHRALAADHPSAYRAVVAAFADYQARPKSGPTSPCTNVVILRQALQHDPEAIDACVEVFREEEAKHYVQDSTVSPCFEGLDIP